MGEFPDDRRRAERVAVNFEFRGNADMPTHVANLSEYGVFVQTQRHLALGTEVELRFTVVLEDPVVIEGRGRVVRYQAEPVVGMGFEFTQLDPEMLLRVADVVRRNRPRDSGPPIDADANPQPESVVRAKRVDAPVTFTPGSGEDEEAAQTLVNLRAVDVEIIEDADLPADDGRDL
ncbi:MAG: PilZ domain-containing protein [Nannocystaceae bacterium]|nr:PilZ domain-containing protein [Nannocystaceae bacterium]